MHRIDLRRFAHCGSGVVATAILALGAGCTVEPAVPPPAAPTYVEGATVSGPAPVESDVDVVYVQEPPVVEIESYPSVEYEGVPVYFVGGQWYRRDARGWAYYRQEPPELGRQRESHDRDPQWVRAREAPRRAAEPIARPEPVASPEPMRQAPVAIPQQAAPPVRPIAEPRRDDRAAQPAVVAPSHPREEEEKAVPAAPKRARPPVKRAPPPAEHR